MVGYGLGITGGIFNRDDSAGIVNVNEDHRLIEELGFDVWWNLVQNGPVGLIEGTTTKSQNVYRFTLTQGRVPLVYMYTEDEYKDLIKEAHYRCRYHFYRVQGKDKRRWYWCRYCHMDFSDKNALSYHRLKDQCDAWKRLTNGQSGVLKMHPIFKPSNIKAVVEVLAQCGLTFPREEGQRPWAPRIEVALNLVEERPPPIAMNRPKCIPMQAKSSGSARQEGGSTRALWVRYVEQVPHVAAGMSPSSSRRLRNHNTKSTPDTTFDSRANVPASPLSYNGDCGMSTWQTVEETGSSTREGEGADKGAQTWSQGLKRLMSVREHRARKKQRVDTASETTLGGGCKSCCEGIRSTMRFSPHDRCVGHDDLRREGR